MTGDEGGRASEPGPDDREPALGGGHVDGAGGDEGDRPRPWRQELLLVAELSALVGFAVVSPVLGPFGEAPESFVAVDASPGDIVVFGLLVSLGPLVLLAGLAGLTRLVGAAARGWVQTALVATLAAVAVVVVVRDLGASAPLRTIAAVVAAFGAGALHRRWEPARSFLRFASPAPAVFLALFLFASSVSPLLSPEDVAPSSAAGGQPPVVMIVFDELPTLSLVEQGEIDADLFPNLARVAATSTWYRNATTVADRTALAVPALVTGQGPEAEQVAGVAANFPESLFALLGPTHDVHGVEWSTELCPPSLCDGDTPVLDDDAKALTVGAPPEPDAPVRELADEAGSLWWEQAAPWAATPTADYEVTGFDDPAEILLPGLEFLSGLTPPEGDRPTFDYLHIPVPHQPWRLLPSGETYGAPDPPVGLEFTAWADDAIGEDQAAAARVRHLLQAQWGDRLLGAIIDRLEEQGRWDEAVVVVASDHGVSFTRGMRARVPQPGNEAETAWVPLLIKAPGQSDAEVRDDDARTLAFVPTLADLVGSDIPWDVDGTSLVGPSRRTEPKTIRVRDVGVHPGAGPDGVVELSADGLAAIREAPVRPGPADELQVWRHGRHADLLGRTVEDLGECAAGPTVRLRSPEAGTSFEGGTGEPRRLWYPGTIEADGVRDLAAVVDGTVVGWAASAPNPKDNPFGILLAAPLLDEDAPGPPDLYEITDGDGCRLRPLRADG
ncbi:hypothetical protein BH24ACT4_BH24ACT4_13440 [soil metagenome]